MNKPLRKPSKRIASAQVLNAMDVLEAEATRDPLSVRALFLKAARKNTLLFEVTKGVVATANDTFEDLEYLSRRFPAVVNQDISHRGISFSKLKAANGNAIDLRLIPDFLRYNSGEPVSMTSPDAQEVVNRINGVARCGDGTEAEITDAVASGTFKDGTLILARATDLKKLARARKTNPALQRINLLVSTYGGHIDSCVSSTKSDTTPEKHVGRFWHFVSLKSGKDTCHNSFTTSKVILLRGFNCG